MISRFAQRAVQAVPLACLALAASIGHAAPVAGPSGLAFYTPPASMPAGTQGDLISYSPAQPDLGVGAPDVKAWRVMYRSTDSVGAPNVVTGMVIVPTKAWANAAEARPIVSYAVGTHGLAQGCAPSIQLEKGTDYESANIRASLDAGYAVLVSDYQGYTTGSTPTYLAGASQGNAVLDIVRAAGQIPSGGVNASAKTAIWGYSQGGQSAAWAAQRHAGYAPNVNLVGVAAGGVPGDFLTTAKYLDGNNGASFLFSGIIGLSTQYPTAIPLNDLANATGQAAIARGKQQCVFESLFDLMNRNLSEFTVGNQTLDQLLTALPAAKQAVVAQDLGGDKVNVPLYQYHGQADEFIPLAQAVSLKKKYCGKFSNVTFDLYPSEHIVTQFQAAPKVLGWLGDRFSGKSTAGSCSYNGPEPQSTANPVNGNFVVSLKEWMLSATVGLKTLGQTVTMPPESTFTADADMTAKRLAGELNIPDFKQKLNIIGLPVQVGLSVKPVGQTTGTVELNNAGMLKIRGMAYADITITSVFGIPFGECKTSKPVEFPINFDGPVSALGSGNLTFSGTTSFPMIKGCFISAILSTMMSGSGQTYTFTVSPKAPVQY